MRPSVAAIFPTFTERFEGHTAYLYLDVKGLVTCGRGNLVDPLSFAQALPWTHPGGTPATSDEIADAWTAVKRAQWLAPRGGAAFAPLTLIRLSEEAIDGLTAAKMQANDRTLASRFDGWEDLPADVQLAVHSLAWACGPAFRFPHFEAALTIRDYPTCAVECQMASAQNPGLAPRNAADRALFLSAANGGDPTTVNGWQP